MSVSADGGTPVSINPDPAKGVIGRSGPISRRTVDDTCSSDTGVDPLQSRRMMVGSLDGGPAVPLDSIGSRAEHRVRASAVCE